MRALPLFIACRSLNTLADQLLLFITPLLIFRATNSIANAGLAFAIEWLPRLIALPLGGIVVDRLGGRGVYLISDLVRGVVAVTALHLALNGGAELGYVLAVLAGIIGFFHETSFVAFEGTLPRLVATNRYASAQSTLQAIDQGGMLLGPAMAALLAHWLPLEWLYGIVAVLYAISALNVWRMGDHLSADASASGVTLDAVVSDLRAALAIVGESRELKLLTLLTMSVNLMYGVALATAAPHMQVAFGAGERSFGFLGAGSGAAGILIFLLAPRVIDVTGVKTVGIVAFAFAVLAQLAMGLASSFVAYAIGYAIMAVADGLVNIYIRSERLRHIPSDRLAAVLGVIVLGNFSVLPLAGLAVSCLVPIFGVPGLLGITAAVGAFCGGVVLWCLNAKHHLI